MSCQFAETDNVVCVSTQTHSLPLKHPICHCWRDKHTYCVVTLLQDDTIVGNNSRRKYEPTGVQDRIAIRVQHLHNTFQRSPPEHNKSTQLLSATVRISAMALFSERLMLAGPQSKRGEANMQGARGTLQTISPAKAAWKKMVTQFVAFRQ